MSLPFSRCNVAFRGGSIQRPRWAALDGLLRRARGLGGLAALRPRWLGDGIGRALLAASVAAFVVLTILYWPPVSGFWHEETWRMGDAVQGDAIAEQSREGMGLMIATAVFARRLRGQLATRSRPAAAGALTALHRMPQ